MRMKINAVLPVLIMDDSECADREKLTVAKSQYITIKIRRISIVLWDADMSPPHHAEKIRTTISSLIVHIIMGNTHKMVDAGDVVRNEKDRLSVEVTHFFEGCDIDSLLQCLPSPIWICREKNRD